MIGEEALFRGLLWDIARSAGWPEPVALVVTTVLFALSHLQYHDFQVTAESAGQVGYTLLAGVVLGGARLRTRSIAAPVLLHGTGNAVLKLLAHLPD